MLLCLESLISLMVFAMVVTTTQPTNSIAVTTSSTSLPISTPIATTRKALPCRPAIPSVNIRHMSSQNKTLSPIHKLLLGRAYSSKRYVLGIYPQRKDKLTIICCRPGLWLLRTVRTYFRRAGPAIVFLLLLLRRLKASSASLFREHHRHLYLENSTSIGLRTLETPIFHVKGGSPQTRVASIKFFLHFHGIPSAIPVRESKAWPFKCAHSRCNCSTVPT